MLLFLFVVIFLLPFCLFVLLFLLLHTTSVGTKQKVVYNNYWLFGGQVK